LADKLQGGKMGLDVFAARCPEIELTEEDERAFDEAGIELCGGIFSGGDSGFRGKVYDMLILDLTDVSLYQAWIPPETVQQMAEALHRIDPLEFEKEVAGNYSWEDYSAHTIIHLCKFFDLCVERGLGLVGSW
jgi:hypothetical protein